MTFVNLNIKELIDKLVDSKLIVDTELVREIVKRNDTPDLLLEILKEDEYWEIDGKGDGWLPIHSIFILGLIGNDEAFEALRYILLHRAEELGDWVPEDVASILANFGSSYFEKIKEIAMDVKYDMYVRDASVRALCVLAFKESSLKDELFKIFKKLLTDEENKELVSLLLPNMAEFRDELIFEGIKFFMTKYPEVAKEVVSVEEIEDIHKGIDEYPEHLGDMKDLWEHFSKENLNYLHEINYGKPLIQPIKIKKVGRNEPCPCGSGKKYKKCCGKLV